MNLSANTLPTATPNDPCISLSVLWVSLLGEAEPWLKKIPAVKLKPFDLAVVASSFSLYCCLCAEPPIPSAVIWRMYAKPLKLIPSRRLGFVSLAASFGTSSCFVSCCGTLVDGISFALRAKMLAKNI